MTIFRLKNTCILAANSMKFRNHFVSPSLTVQHFNDCVKLCANYTTNFAQVELYEEGNVS